jgi:hypothetical protein
MGWQPFDLDHRAQKLVLQARELDRESLNQAYKMRATCAYGLERFWGEYLRLKDKEFAKGVFVQETWAQFIAIMEMTRPDLTIPPVMAAEQSEAVIMAAAEQFWCIPPSDQQECLTVLVALCDAIVWWTQRLKIKPVSLPEQAQQEASGPET